MADLISPADAARLFASGAQIIDVRSAGSREKFGTVDGSVAVDKAEVTSTFENGTDRDRPVVVYCGSEKGSVDAAGEIEALGYTNVSHVLGGYPALAEHGVATSGGE